MAKAVTAELILGCQDLANVIVKDSCSQQVNRVVARLECEKHCRGWAHRECMAAQPSSSGGGVQEDR